MEELIAFEGFGGKAPKSPAWELLSLAAPTVAQMASYTVMQFVDTWMLSRLGPDAPTAGANSGIMAFSVIAFGVGMMWIVNALASQAYGRKDYHECGRFLWQGVWTGLVYSCLLVMAIPLAEPMFRAFGHPANLIPMESAYYRIALAGASFKLVGTAFGQFLLAIDRPLPVLGAAATGVAVNIVVAYAIVLGHFGFHSYGVAGSSIATNIGCCCEMLTLIFFAFRTQGRKDFGVRDWLPRKAEMKALLKWGVPAGLQFVTDILAWGLFCNVVIAQVGDKAMAANTFMMRYMVISFMPAIGVSMAATAIVGRYVGARRPDLAVRRTHLAFMITAAWQISCGIFFFAGRRFLLSAFTSDEQVLAIGALYMTYSAFYQLFDSAYIVYCGALRGAGDTIVPAVVTAVLNWTINVTGGYLVARYWRNLGPGGPWMVSTFYGASLGLFMVIRFLRGKWKTMHGIPNLFPEGFKSDGSTDAATDTAISNPEPVPASIA
jgi:MATE family multidrug resistance protein